MTDKNTRKGRVSTTERAQVLTSFCALGKDVKKTAELTGISSTSIRAWWKNASEQEKERYEMLAFDTVCEADVIEKAKCYLDELYDLRQQALATMDSMLREPYRNEVNLGQVTSALKELNTAIKEETGGKKNTSSIFDDNDIIRS